MQNCQYGYFVLLEQLSTIYWIDSLRRGILEEEDFRFLMLQQVLQRTEASGKSCF